MYTCILLTEKIKCIFYLLCCHCLSKTQNHTTLHMSGKRNQSIDRKWGGRGAFKTCLKVDSLGRSRVQSCTLGTSSVVLLLDRCWLHGQLAGLAQRAKLPKRVRVDRELMTTVVSIMRGYNLSGSCIN